MRRVPHPVVVVTSTDTSECSPGHDTASADDTSRPPSDLESCFRGMTVSSFNTVSLSPQPLVSLNVRLPSATYAALAHSRTFLAHILAASPEGARIADAFAKGNSGSSQAFAELAREARGSFKVFAGSSMQWAPLLSGLGVLRVLRCIALPGKEIVVGDHVVLVGQVVGILEGKETGGGPRHGANKENDGLVYVDQGYCAVGERIDPHAAPPLPSESNALGVEDAKVPFLRTLGMNIRRGDEVGGSR